MQLFLATLLNPLIALPKQKNSTLEERFFDCIVTHNYPAIFELYLQSGLIQRQALLDIISKNEHSEMFIDHLNNAPENYLSALFLAVMQTQKAKQEKHSDDELNHAQAAYELYITAQKINEEDVLVYAKLLDNLQLLNECSETWEHYYQKGLQCDRHNFYLHQTMSNLLQKDGFKGRKKALQLARQLTKCSLKGSPNHHLIAQAHIQEWLFLGTQKNKALQKSYFKHPIVADEINRAYELFTLQRLPNTHSLRASQNFMFCFYMNGDILKLNKELRFNNNELDFSSSPWSYFRFPTLRYNMILRLCGLYPCKQSKNQVIITNIVNA